MRIFNENKTQELNKENIDHEKGYLKPDKLFIAHHEAVEAKQAVYDYREVEEESGGTSLYPILVEPVLEAKEAYDEYEDVQVYVPYTEEELKEHKLSKLRRQREVVCFSIINRGQLWYDTLTETQKIELREWYVAWLNVTETLVVPTKPKWIK